MLFCVSETEHHCELHEMESEILYSNLLGLPVLPLWGYSLQKLGQVTDSEISFHISKMEIRTPFGMFFIMGGKEKGRLPAPRCIPPPTPPLLPARPPAPGPPGRRDYLLAKQRRRGGRRSAGGPRTAALYSLNTHRSLSEVRGLSGWHIVCE